MCAGVRSRSRSEQKAIFANLFTRLRKANSYNDFSDKVNREFISDLKVKVSEPIGPTLKRLDDEFKKDIPTLVEFVRSDDNWFERKKTKFSNGNDTDFGEEEETTTVLL
jgi:hypothetical protein